MDIKCKKTLCEFNNCESCQAKGILIAKNLECKTFEKGNKPKRKLCDVSKRIFEVAPEVVPYRHNKSLHIDCKAECLFNVNGVCCANGITLVEGSKTGMCATNLKK